MNRKVQVEILECNLDTLGQIIEKLESLMDQRGHMISIHWNTLNDIVGDLEEVQKTSSNVCEHIYRKRLYGSFGSF